MRPSLAYIGDVIKLQFITWYCNMFMASLTVMTLGGRNLIHSHRTDMYKMTLIRNHNISLTHMFLMIVYLHMPCKCNTSVCVWLGVA